MEVHHIAELICASVGIITLLVFKIKYKKFFFSLLAFVCFSFVIDASGFAFTKKFNSSNGWLYNLYDLIKFPFFITFFTNSLIEENKKIRNILLSIYFFALLIDAKTIVSANDLLSFSKISAELMLIILCFRYYIRLLKRPEYRPITKSPGFWFVNGIFFYFLSVLPYHILWHPMVNAQLDDGSLLYIAVITIANLIHYAFFTLALILCLLPSRKLFSFS